MVTRKCGKCDTVWRSELTHCAFCGHEGVDQSASSVAVLERPRNGVPKPKDTLPPAVFSLETQAPETKAPIRELAETAGPSAAFVPASAPAKVVAPPPAAAPVPPALPVPASDPVPSAPRLPSPNVPVLFALMGLVAAALLPAGAWVAGPRVTTVLVFLGVALLTPFAPLAWWTGARYESRCEDLGFRPAFSARFGRALGLGVTLLLAAEGSVLAFLRALDGLRN